MKRIKSVTRRLFVTTQIAALFWVSISYLIALYATVRLGQAFPVVENIFEHNNSPVFGTTNEAAKETKIDF